MNFSYDNPSKRGIRIALRAKVNDSSITGLRVVDSILPVGRGQRQLISGDRYTGKTPSSLSMNSLMKCSLGLKCYWFRSYRFIDQPPKTINKDKLIIYCGKIEEEYF